MRHLVRIAASGVILATTAMSGLVIGPTPQPASALIAVAVNDSLTMKHDRTAVVPAPGVMANDIIVLGATVQLVWGVTHGTLSLQSNGGYTYSPAAGYIGSDQFRYQLSGLGTAATVTITITNAAPVAKPDAYTWAGGTLVVAAPGVLANDTDADPLTAILESDVANGTLTLNPDGSFAYTPEPDFNGLDSFTYRATDGLALSVISYGEVTEGVLGSPRRLEDLTRWADFLTGCDILDVTFAIADRWAELRYYLRVRGQIVGDNDLLIAATAMQFGMKVVTGNARHFGRIPGLDVMVPEL